MPEYLQSTHARSNAELLASHGLRPTKQRLYLSRFLFNRNENCHITAEQLHSMVKEHGHIVSLATVYNTLNQFVQAGLLREVIVNSTRSFFDTNTAHHHHFLCEETGSLTDIPAEHIALESIPVPPEGSYVTGFQVTIKVQPA